jgi:adenine-specific DNA-methyltransferase
MAAINDLIKQIEDKALRDRLTQEVERINNNKKFCLVFEEHLPRITPIYGASIKKGSIVCQKRQKNNEIYFVCKH